MSDSTISGSTTPVAWVGKSESNASPIVKRLPYVEVQLSYPELNATHHNGVFFPHGVPYRVDDEERVFYWSDAVSSSSRSPCRWASVCATTWSVTPIVSRAATRPELWVDHDGRYEVVVDGDVTAEARTTMIRRPSPPAVTLTPYEESHRIVTRSESIRLEVGDSYDQQLPPGQVVLDDEPNTDITVTPRLTVRYPGVRTLYHPAPGSDTVLFPSFGIDLETIPNPVPVQMTGETVDEQALAAELSVTLDERPYAERVLWQAFTYTVFGPHRSEPPRLARTDGDLLILENPT